MGDTLKQTDPSDHYIPTLLSVFGIGELYQYLMPFLADTDKARLAQTCRTFYDYSYSWRINEAAPRYLASLLASKITINDESTRSAFNHWLKSTEAPLLSVNYLTSIANELAKITTNTDQTLKPLFTYFSSGKNYRFHFVTQAQLAKPLETLQTLQQEEHTEALFDSAETATQQQAQPAYMLCSYNFRERVWQLGEIERIHSDPTRRFQYSSGKIENILLLKKLSQLNRQELLSYNADDALRQILIATLHEIDFANKADIFIFELRRPFNPSIHYNWPCKWPILIHLPLEASQDWINFSFNKQTLANVCYFLKLLAAAHSLAAQTIATADRQTNQETAALAINNFARLFHSPELAAATANPITNMISEHELVFRAFDNNRCWKRIPLASLALALTFGGLAGGFAFGSIFLEKNGHTRRDTALAISFGLATCLTFIGTIAIFIINECKKRITTQQRKYHTDYNLLFHHPEDRQRSALSPLPIPNASFANGDETAPLIQHANATHFDIEAPRPRRYNE